MSNTSSLSVSESVVVGAVVSRAKRGRPARGKVVREVDWLSGLSSGVEVEVREELELVVGGGVAMRWGVALQRAAEPRPGAARAPW